MPISRNSSQALAKEAKIDAMAAAKAAAAKTAAATAAAKQFKQIKKGTSELPPPPENSLDALWLKKYRESRSGNQIDSMRLTEKIEGEHYGLKKLPNFLRELILKVKDREEEKILQTTRQSHEQQRRNENIIRKKIRTLAKRYGKTEEDVRLQLKNEKEVKTNLRELKETQPKKYKKLLDELEKSNPKGHAALLHGDIGAFIDSEQAEAEGRKRRSKKNKKKKGSKKPRGAQNGKKQSKRRRPVIQKKSRKKKN